MKLFNLDSPVMVFLSKVANLMILNVLTIICCIPIFTAGAAITALYYVTIKMAKQCKDHENGAVYRILPPAADRPLYFPGFVQI